MKLHVDFLTFATSDLDAARAFYRDGLGWAPLLDVPGEIIFFQVGHGLVLGLFDAVKFSADLRGPGEADDGSFAAVSGITLSHNADSPEGVRAVVDAALAAGATLIKEPQRADFGGYHGHFADPVNIIWEVAHNPAWRVDADGTVRLGLVEAPDA